MGTEGNHGFQSHIESLMEASACLPHPGQSASNAHLESSDAWICLEILDMLL